MRTSSWISTSSLLLSLLLTGACSDGGGGDDQACWEEEPPTTEGAPATARHRGLVSVRHTVDYKGGSSSTSRSIIAKFSDITLAEMRSRAPAPIMCDANCEGLTGAPYKECIGDPCEVRTLDADGVVVEVGSGKMTLTRQSAGSFNAASVGEPLFGSTPVKAVVQSSGNAGFFPAYAQSLDPPDLIDLKHPDPASDQPVGSSDLKLTWTPGNGDLILVQLQDAEDPSVTDKVRCILQDDGCHTVGACALEWLGIKTGGKFKLSIARIRDGVQTLDSNTAATLSLVSELETTLTR